MNYKKSFIISLLSFVFIQVSYSGPDDDIYTQINRNMDIFGRVYKEIMLNYVDEINGDKLIKAGIDGMLETLDPYTNFLDESRKDEVDLLTTGKYGGIGITVGLKDSHVVITDVLEGYIAQKEGLKKGDKIIEIDGMSVIGKQIREVRALTRGQPGTKVKIKISRGDRELEFILTREEIQLKNISYKGILDHGIGYIKLDRFNKYAENEMTEALNELKAKGEMQGLILDLRDNPGGLLDAALGILDKLTPKGRLLLTTKGRKRDSEQKFFSNESPVISPDVPIIVIINENTASASEVVAGSLQDLDRAVILGTESFGKGLVQIFQQLSYGTQLKITNQKYFTPSGRWIQSKNYFKENKAGVFKPNPYFSQTEFKTIGGRLVYAEGGIMPDKIVDFISDNELLEALNAEEMYYKFAVVYTENNPYIETFEVDNTILKQFYDFIIKSDFNYTTVAEKQLSKLRKDAELKGYSDRVINSIKVLEEQIRDEKYKDFDKSRSVIKSILEIEILKKYNRPDKLITESRLKNDLQLQEAITILKDKGYYNSFLEVR